MSALALLRAALLAALTPLLEKNVVKTMGLDVPLVFSMSRLIVLAFAAGMLRQLWGAGVAGWPEATLAMAIVLALPTLGALERLSAEQVVELSRTLVGRFGIGESRRVTDVYAGTAGIPGTEPSKHDDHRVDA